MNFSVELESIPLPIRIRPSAPMDDDALMEFCAHNEMLAIEKDANGEIIVMSPSGTGTGSTNSDLNFELVFWNRQIGRGVVFDSNTGFTLPDGSMRSPDAAWISSSRWDALSKRDRARFAPICPEFVIELRSPSDRLAPLQDKMQMWISNGAQLAWLIDPQEKAVTVYRPNAEPERLDNVSQVTGDGPVAGFVLPLDRIFA